jgi:hypothetical protein
MTSSILSRASGRSVFQATASALGVLAMTSIHHVYGAAIFETPWRLHIVFISIPVALLILAAVAVARSGNGARAGKVASWIYVGLVALFAIAAVGIYEGGYNHLIPNIQHVLGVEHPLREGLYEPPDDLFFQLTGIAQFVIAVIAAWTIRKLVWSGRR